MTKYLQLDLFKVNFYVGKSLSNQYLGSFFFIAIPRSKIDINELGFVCCLILSQVLPIVNRQH